MKYIKISEQRLKNLVWWSYKHGKNDCSEKYFREAMEKIIVTYDTTYDKGN